MPKPFERYFNNSWVIMDEMSETPDAGGGAAANASSPESNESAGGNSDPQYRQDPNQNSNANQNYIDRDAYNKGYDSLKGTFDKKYGELNNELNMTRQELQVMKPIIDAIKGQSQQEVNPLRQKVLSNPIAEVIAMREELEQFKGITGQQQELINSLVNRYAGAAKESQINETYASKFPDKTSFERAKHMAVNKHRPIMEGLMGATNGDAVKAFGMYTHLLKSGQLNDGTPETEGLAKQLTQSEARLAKFANSGYNDSMLTNSNSNSGQKPPDSLFSFTF
jgi:hypothetical protein